MQKLWKRLPPPRRGLRLLLSSSIRASPTDSRSCVRRRRLRWAEIVIRVFLELGEESEKASFGAPRADSPTCHPFVAGLRDRGTGPRLEWCSGDMVKVEQVGHESKTEMSQSAG